jgi:hypothetical protein
VVVGLAEAGPRLAALLVLRLRHRGGGDSPSGEAELHFYDHRFPVAPGTGDGTAREVHDRQHYRLVHWREPLLGYRRFFTVTGLAGLRQEDPEVFEATHAEVRRWCEEDLVDAIRVDHPDGLADPVGYARRLRALAGDDRVLLVEKILTPCGSSISCSSTPPARPGCPSSPGATPATLVTRSRCTRSPPSSNGRSWWRTWLPSSRGWRARFVARWRSGWTARRATTSTRPPSGRR